MSRGARSTLDIAPGLARIATRPILVRSPLIHFRLEPGDRALVKVGDQVVGGMPIAEVTPDAELVDAGRISTDNGRVGPRQRELPPPREDVSPLWKVIPDDQPGEREVPRPAPKLEPQAARSERRQPPHAGKWWVGGDERRGKPPKNKPNTRVAGTLLYESQGRWRAAAGERHEIVESPVGGVVKEARNGYGVTIEAIGSAIPAAIAAGEPARGYLDVPRLTDGELWAAALDTGRSGAVVVAGSRISSQAISRARAMSIRGLIAGSVGQGELADLASSIARQKASLAPSAPFGLIALDGYQRRPLPTPVLALLAALAGQEVAIVIDPPLLIFDQQDVPLPDLPPDWVRVRSGIHAGREGRWLESAGLYRFHSGIHLEASVVRFVDDTHTTVVPIGDLERFEY